MKVLHGRMILALREHVRHGIIGLLDRANAWATPDWLVHDLSIHRDIVRVDRVLIIEKRLATPHATRSRLRNRVLFRANQNNEAQ